MVLFNSIGSLQKSLEPNYISSIVKVDGTI